MNTRQPLTALIVDDETDLAWALQQNLHLDGWQVAVAHTGAAAIAYVITHAPRIAFVDAKLPDMDGLDVIRRIGELSTEITVVLISGYYYAEDPEVREMRSKGLIVHFIAKPLDLHEVSALASQAAGEEGLPG
jgi:DNA-binding NtrC family response regulator